jgi:serine protease Do
MMNKRGLFFSIFLMFLASHVFGQASPLRDYVGMISQTFRSDVITFLNKLKDDLEKRNRTNVARNLEAYIRGDSGTGFAYIAPDGTNYILTNYHVISQALSLTVSFEKPDGEKTVFSDLNIVAADEEMDIALLGFADGQKPFKEGLRFYTRTLAEGDDVYSAGFPGLGTSMIWQLGRGMVSNVSVRIPADDGTERMLGPFIQHTAQVDPGNSGGPLLVQTSGAPSGYTVAGINTLKARFRQAANYSIPVSRIQSFLDASLNKGEVDQRALLDARLESFIEGLKGNKSAYAFITSYLSHSCTGENSEYALTELLSKAPQSIQDDIINIFGHSPVEGMSQAVGWLIESRIRSGNGNIDITVDDVTPNDDAFTVTFKINGRTVSSEWVNEYGIWRIYKFGAYASGDKKLQSSPRLRTGNRTSLLMGAGGVLLAEPNDMYGSGNLAIGLELLARGNYYGIGFRSFFRRNSSNEYFHSYFHLELQNGYYFPIRLGDKAALTPHANMGIGFEVKDKLVPGDSLLGGFFDKNDIDIGASFILGLHFTTSAVPGLYLFADYQYNLFFRSTLADNVMKVPHAVFVGAGYTFTF